MSLAAESPGLCRYKHMQLAAYLEMTPPAGLYLAMSRPLYVGVGGGGGAEVCQACA